MNTVSVDYKGLSSGTGIPVVCVPLSKSMAARALILDYIRGEERERDLPDCADTRDLAAAISRLKGYIPNLPDYIAVCHEGKGGAPVHIKEGFDMGSGATSLRFFLALVASIPGLKTELRCSEQLKSRPIMPLIKVLREFGADIVCKDREGYPPMMVTGGRLSGGRADLPVGITSQYLSALMLVEQLWDNKLSYDYDESEQVSLPYLNMTAYMVRRSGESEIEADWSAAAFFYEMAVLAEGMEIEIVGLKGPGHSVQGDSRCAEIFRKLGVVTEFLDEGGVRIRMDGKILDKLRDSGEMIGFDMSRNPDIVPPLAVGMALAGIRFELKKVGNLRYKESDRLLALVSELHKLGLVLEIDGDSLIYKGESATIDGAQLCSWGDHRIAMALAVASVNRNGIEVDKECVSKSFPGFFEQLAQLGFEVKDKCNHKEGDIE